MKCPNCRCEIGNLTTCPYCGAVLYRRGAVPPTTGVRTQAVTSPVETRTMEAPPRLRQDTRRDRHLNNLDTWGLLCAILLGGIFALEFLQLLIQLQ